MKVMFMQTCLIVVLMIIGNNFILGQNLMKDKSHVTNKMQLQSDTEEFETLNTFLLETQSNAKQSYDLYLKRIIKIRRKKEIIIRKVFEIVPILGEILALANVEKINLIVNKFFITRETDLLKKYIIMWDTNPIYDEHSSKVLLNLLLCNNKFNKLRCILNLLMEGLCQGDDRSIKIFKEIVMTVIIDTLLKTKFYYFNDLQAKFNLIRMLNKGFQFKPVTKIQFLEKMFISDKLKELLTYMILKLKSKEDIEIEMDFILHQPAPLIANNTNLFQFNPREVGDLTAAKPETQEEKIVNMQKELDKNLSSSNQKSNIKPISRVDANDILENLKLISDSKDFKFKEKLYLDNYENENLNDYSELSFLEEASLQISTPLKVKLSEIKEEIKNEYNEMLFNLTFYEMRKLEEPMPNYQVGISKRTIYPKYIKHIQNLIRLNFLLDQFPPTTPRGSINVASPEAVKIDIKAKISKEVAPGVTVSMQFKEKNNEKSKNKNDNSKKDNMKEQFRFKSSSLLKSRLKSRKFSTTTIATMCTREDDFAERSFELLMNQRKDNNNYNEESQQTQESPSENNQNYNYNESTSPPSNNENMKPRDPKNPNNYNAPDNNEIKEQIINQNDNIKDLLDQKSKEGETKVLFPKEIHTNYKVTKRGKKTIEINTNSKIF
jgi:hypothetical protein